MLRVERLVSFVLTRVFGHWDYELEMISQLGQTQSVLPLFDTPTLDLWLCMTQFRSGPWADDVGFEQHVGGLVHWALWPPRRAQGSQ